jgi:hypothetical protein
MALRVGLYPALRRAWSCRAVTPSKDAFQVVIPAGDPRRVTEVGGEDLGGLGAVGDEAGQAAGRVRVVAQLALQGKQVDLGVDLDAGRVQRCTVVTRFLATMSRSDSRPLPHGYASSARGSKVMTRHVARRGPAAAPTVHRVLAWRIVSPMMSSFS